VVPVGCPDSWNELTPEVLNLFVPPLAAHFKVHGAAVPWSKLVSHFELFAKLVEGYINDVPQQPKVAAPEAAAVGSPAESAAAAALASD
jgi:hypothetical protein